MNLGFFLDPIPVNRGNEKEEPWWSAHAHRTTTIEVIPEYASLYAIHHMILALQFLYYTTTTTTTFYASLHFFILL